MNKDNYVRFIPKRIPVDSQKWKWFYYHIPADSSISVEKLAKISGSTLDEAIGILSILHKENLLEIVEPLDLGRYYTDTNFQKLEKRIAIKQKEIDRLLAEVNLKFPPPDGMKITFLNNEILYVPN